MKKGCTYRVKTYPLMVIAVAHVSVVDGARFVLVKHLIGKYAGGFDLVRESSLDVEFCSSFDQGATGVISMLQDGNISLGAARKAMAEEYGVTVYTHCKDDFIRKLRALMSK